MHRKTRQLIRLKHLDTYVCTKYFFIVSSCMNFESKNKSSNLGYTIVTWKSWNHVPEYFKLFRNKFPVLMLLSDLVNFAFIARSPSLLPTRSCLAYHLGCLILLTLNRYPSLVPYIFKNKPESRKLLVTHIPSKEENQPNQKFPCIFSTVKNVGGKKSQTLFSPFLNDPLKRLKMIF